MKKILASILLVLYFAFSSGVVVNLHYCMDRIDSFSLSLTKTEICGKCGMETTDAGGCCHSDVKVVKIDDDQLASLIEVKFNAPAVIQQPVVYERKLLAQNSSVTFSVDHSPPLNRQDTYLVNCVFRI